MNQNDVIEEIEKLEEELDIVQNQQKIASINCKICNKNGSDVISYYLKVPVHNNCHIKSLPSYQHNQKTT